MKVLRVGITDTEWDELKNYITHHGQLSFVLREAIRMFITKSKTEAQQRGELNGQGGGSKGRGTKKS